MAHDQLPTPTGDPPTLDTHCARCLDAHLLATELGRPVTCPGCGADWYDPPPLERRVDIPADLGAVARCFATIYGRALPLGAPEGGRGARVDGRPEHVDEHHRDARSGVRTAMAAITRLDQLERLGYQLEADVLWFAYVVSGETLAARHGGVENLVASRFAAASRLAHWKGHKARRVRQVQMRAHGGSLLAQASDAYEALVRGQLAARPTSPGEILRAHARDADAVRQRIEQRLGRVAKVASK